MKRYYSDIEKFLQLTQQQREDLTDVRFDFSYISIEQTESARWDSFGENLKKCINIKNIEIILPVVDSMDTGKIKAFGNAMAVSNTGRTQPLKIDLDFKVIPSTHLIEWGKILADNKQFIKSITGNHRDNGNDIEVNINHVIANFWFPLLTENPYLEKIELLSLNLSNDMIENLTVSYASMNTLLSLIERLPALTTLNFISTSIGRSPQDIFERFCATIPKLKKLQNLGLDNTKLMMLDEENGDLLKSTLAQCTFLNISLYRAFYTNRRRDQDLTLGNLLTSIRSVNILNLGDNVISSLNETQFDEFCASLSQMQNLKSLDLSYNQLNKTTRQIGKLLNSIRSVESLNLAYNKIGELSEERFDEFCASLSQMQNLKHLNLSSNDLHKLTPQRLKKLGDTLVKLKKLESLDLSDNSLYKLSIEAWLSFARINDEDTEDNVYSKLKTINIGNNSIDRMDDLQWYVFGAFLSKFQSLHTLKLHDSPPYTISATRWQILGEHLAKIFGLRTLMASERNPAAFAKVLKGPLIVSIGTKEADIIIKQQIARNILTLRKYYEQLINSTTAKPRTINDDVLSIIEPLSGLSHYDQALLKEIFNKVQLEHDTRGNEPRTTSVAAATEQEPRAAATKTPKPTGS